MAIGMQHSTDAPQIMPNTRFDGQPNTRGLAALRPDASAGKISSGGSLKYIAASGTIGDFEGRVPQHGLAPSDHGNGALEHRWPHRARKVTAAGDQGERGTAPSVEPAADVDVHRRIDAAEADHSDKHTVTDP